MNDLEGKIAIVAAAERGIMKAVAHGFASERATGRENIATVGPVTKKIFAKCHTIGILVNKGGITKDRLLMRLKEAGAIQQNKAKEVILSLISLTDMSKHEYIVRSALFYAYNVAYRITGRVIVMEDIMLR